MHKFAAKGSAAVFDGRRVSRFRMFLVVLTVGAIYFMSNFHRLSLGVAGNSVAEDFGLSPGQLGLLGAILFYTYAIMQLFCGAASDRLQARTLIVSASLLTGIGTLWFARADDFTSLALARSMMGVAVACVYIPALVAFRCWFGEKLFGTATGALVAMGQLGAVCAATPFKLFVDARGWRNAFVPIGYASLLFALAGFFTILRTPQKNSSGQNAPATEKGAFLDPAFWALVAWFAVIGGTRMAFHGLWGTDFFTQVLEKTATHASLFLVWQSAGCMAGAIILGYASDFFGSVRTVVSSGIAMSALWGGLAFLGPETPGWIVGAFNLFLGVFGVGGATAGYSAMRLFSGENNSGLLTGVGNCALIGASAIFLQGAGYFMQIPWSLGEKYFFLLFFFAALCAASSLAFARLRPSNLR